MKTNGWGTVENIRTIKDFVKLLDLFQDFYKATRRLPTFNELLVVPDSDAQPEEKINLKQLYDMFKNTNSHSIVSLPFLGLFFTIFMMKKVCILSKKATTELYKNLSYMILCQWPCSKVIFFNKILHKLKPKTGKNRKRKFS